MDAREAAEASDAAKRAERLQAYIGTRQALGFPSSPSYVERLWGSETDVGSDKYDIPLTAEEEKEWNRRGRYQAAVGDRVIPAARRHQDFAGAYFDNMDGGKLVVLTTGSTSTMLNDLADVDPQLTQDLVVLQTDVTDDQLGELAGDVLDDRVHYFPGITVYAVAVHTPSRALVVRVAEQHVDAARERTAAVSRALGDINITVEAGERAVSRRPPPDLIDEHGGLVERWSFNFDIAHGLAEGEIGFVRPPDRWDVRLVWLAVSCQRSPRIYVDGNDGVISSIVADAGPSIPENCELAGLWHAVDLQTAKPIQGDVTLEVCSGRCRSTARSDTAQSRPPLNQQARFLISRCGPELCTLDGRRRPQ